MRAWLLFGMLLGPVLSFGQSWDSLYLDLHPDTTNSQYLNATVSDGSQGLIGAGDFRPTLGFRSGYVVRFDPNGDTLWTRRFPGVRSFHAIGSAGNGTYLLAAETQNSTIDPPLILIDGNGNVEWQKSYDPAFPQGGLLPYDLLMDDNGGAWVIGRKFWNQVGKWVVVRTDANGDTLWSQSTEDAISTNIMHNPKTLNGSRFGQGCLVTGMYVDDTAAVAYFDQQGQMGWKKYFPEIRHSPRVSATSDGNYLLAGIGGSTVPWENELVVLKIDAAGTILWQAKRDFNGAYVSSIHETADGYLLTGMYTDTVATSFPFATKLGFNGDSCWDYVSNQLIGRSESGFLVSPTEFMFVNNRYYHYQTWARYNPEFVTVSVPACTSTVVESMHTTGELIAYPNPTSDRIQINWPEGSTGSYQLQVLDVQGKLLRNETVVTGNDRSPSVPGPAPPLPGHLLPASNRSAGVVGRSHGTKLSFVHD